MLHKADDQQGRRLFDSHGAITVAVAIGGRCDPPWPADAPRRITAGGEGYTAAVTAGTARARTPDGADHGTPPWIA
ncbi:hypothetical protein GCM10009830_34630 [Glycomyces endophyticus]|uniref:Uncharacterized protein n=1 Tax=Glycomyces endophyticus TaxID=480996 RepID=A0ABN2HA04_9ACTN